MTAEDQIQFMLDVAEQYFQTTEDEGQIPITSASYEKLLTLGYQTLFFKDIDQKPIGWVLVIPTTLELKDMFLQNKISEKDLLFKTPIQKLPEAVYLCAAFVLPEHRTKGIALALSEKAINYYRELNPTIALFAWIYSPEGERLIQTLQDRLHVVIETKSEPSSS